MKPDLKCICQLCYCGIEFCTINSTIAKKTTNHREKHIFVRYPDTTECCHPRIVMKKKKNSAYLQLFWRKYLRMIIRIKDGKLYMASSSSFSGKLLRCVAKNGFSRKSICYRVRNIQHRHSKPPQHIPQQTTQLHKLGIDLQPAPWPKMEEL